MPIDVLLINGDCIEGKGIRSGGNELIIPDPIDQGTAFTEFAMIINAKQIYMAFGTPYHSGIEQENEKHIAKILEADIKQWQWLKFNGVVIEMRHHVGSSQVPYSRRTAITREQTWNLIKAQKKQIPEMPNISLRSHVHYYTFGGDADWLGLTLPALQASGSRFGTSVCSGTVDLGMVVIDISKRGRYLWEPFIYDMPVEVLEELGAKLALES